MAISGREALVRLCAFATLVLAVTPVAADIVQVPDKAEITVTGVRDGTFSVDGTELVNGYSTVLDFAGDATIKIEYPEGQSGGYVCFGVIATNGTVTLDLTSIGDKTFVLENGALVNGNGSLIVKGRDSLRLGNEAVIGLSGYNNYAPPAGVANVEYRDTAGAVYQNPEGLILVGRVLEWALPATTPWKLDADAKPCIIRGDSKIMQSMLNEENEVVLENREMWIYDVEALPSPTTPVRVGAGSELVIILRAVNAGTYFSQAGASDRTLENPINISEGGVLNLRSHDFTVSGAVSGGGTLRYTETSSARAFWTKVSNVSNFTGEVSCEHPNSTLMFGNDSFDGVTMTLCDGSTVELGCDAVDGYSVTIEELTGPESGSASLVLSAENPGAVSINEKSGNVAISGGAGYAKTEVAIGTIAVGDALVMDMGSYRFTLPDDVVSRPDVFALTRTNGRNVYLRSGSSSSVDFLGFDIPETGDYKLTARNGVSYQNVPENVHVIVPEGVSAELALQHNARANVRMEGGSLSLAYAEPLWKSKVLFWMDPSDENSVVSNGTRMLSGITYPVVSGMNDTRQAQTDIKLGYYSIVNTTWPTLFTNGVNGLSYLSCDKGGNRRIWFGGYGGVSFKYAIMVFGSQLGGGQGIIGNTDGYYARGGELSQSITKDSPIFANDITTYVNGRLVNAQEQCLNGGWEIISFDTSGAVVHGIGFNGAVGTSSNAKGQNYGEVLLFSETPTSAERIAAERYLAEKWGLSEGYLDTTDLTPEVRVDGDGDIELKGDFRMTGAYSGTVSLNGKTLAVPDEAVPPADADIAGIDGRLAWFDPDLVDAVNLDARTDSVDKIFDRVLGKNPPDGSPVLNSGGRRPKLVQTARGFGPSRSWVDYSPAHFWTEKDSNYGRTLRLNAAPTYGTTVVPLSARTVFVVQDSVKGGGSAFLSAVNGYGDIVSRLTKWPEMQPDPGLPVWRDATADVFKDGATYLDGREIDGAVEGFQGRPELLTAVGGRNFNLGAFGFYGYLQDVEDNVDYGEVQGEIIVYDRVLDDAARGQIEAYLMWKWLGLAREGYSVASNMTVSGEGKVNVSSLTQMPKFASSFTGTAAMEESAYRFTIGADGSVAGKIDMGSAKMSFPASCTATVSFAEGARGGEYTLVSCGGFASDTAWTLDLQSGTSRKVSLVSRNGALVLEVSSRGTVLTIR